VATAGNSPNDTCSVRRDWVTRIPAATFAHRGTLRADFEARGEIPCENHPREDSGRATGTVSTESCELLLLQHRIDRRRRGVVTIEVLGVVPLLIIFAVSVAEFSMAMRLHQRVAFASRYGAKLASEAPRFGTQSLSQFNTGSSDLDLKARIDRWLVSTGLSRSLAVRLDHNACGVEGRLQTRIESGLNLPNDGDLPDLPAPAADGNGCYVRVTVWLPLDRNLPNALKTFGLDWSGATIRHSTVFRLETDNQPPVPAVELLSQQLPQGFQLQTSAADGGSLSPAAIRISADRHGPLELSFSARGSRDAETPRAGLSYHWTTTAQARGMTNSEAFRARLDLRPGVHRQTFNVALDVTDECSCSSKLMVPVEVTRNDALGTP